MCVSCTVWPPTIGVEECFNNVMAAAEFEVNRGGALFELTTSGVGGGDIANFSFHYVDGFKKALVLHTILAIFDDFVLTLHYVCM